MPLNLGDEFPNFEAETTDGPIKFHEWLAGSWAVLFSHPRDYTPVCTTEAGHVLTIKDEFVKRGVKLIFLSCDGIDDHKGWSKDILEYKGCDPNEKFPFPLIADPKRDLAVKFGMLDPDEKDADGMPLTCRACFVIGPDRKLKLSILYPATTGRNFDELLRVIDSLKLTAEKKVATPANWKNGEKCMVIPSIKTEDAKKIFPKGVEVKAMLSGKEYMRFTPDPSD